MAYNDSRCPVTVIGETLTKNTVSATCQMPPSNFCGAFADPFEGKTNKEIHWTTSALASECIIPTLVQSRKLQEKYAAVVSDNDRNEHYRWLYFILFSAVIGGKVANTTSQALKFDKREPKDKHRLWRSAKCASRMAIDVVGAGRSYVFSIFRRVASAARKH